MAARDEATRMAAPAPEEQKAEAPAFVQEKPKAMAPMEAQNDESNAKTPAQRRRRRWSDHGSEEDHAEIEIPAPEDEKGEAEREAEEARDEIKQKEEGGRKAGEEAGVNDRHSKWQFTQAELNGMLPLLQQFARHMAAREREAVRKRKEEDEKTAIPHVDCSEAQGTGGRAATL